MKSQKAGKAKEDAFSMFELMWRKLKLPRMRNFTVLIFWGGFFDKNGNLENWSSMSRSGFYNRENCLANQYSDFKVQGKKVKRTYISRHGEECTKSTFTSSQPHPAK